MLLWNGLAWLCLRFNIQANPRSLANGKQMTTRCNGVVRKGNCTLTQNSPSNFLLLEDFQICIDAFGGCFI